MSGPGASSTSMQPRDEDEAHEAQPQLLGGPRDGQVTLQPRKRVESARKDGEEEEVDDEELQILKRGKGCNASAGKRSSNAMRSNSQDQAPIGSKKKGQAKRKGVDKEEGKKAQVAEDKGKEENKDDDQNPFGGDDAGLKVIFKVFVKVTKAATPRRRLQVWFNLYKG
ncbi:hypothetical protein V8C86DRAFT_3120870 [Haematococcus lacustris]